MYEVGRRLIPLGCVAILVDEVYYKQVIQSFDGAFLKERLARCADVVVDPV